MPLEPIIPKGAHLGTSRKVAGAVSGNAYTTSGKNLGPVAWRFVDSLRDEVPPNILGLVPLALVAVAGVAVSVAGIKAAQQLKSQREDEISKWNKSIEPPAGWYVEASDATLLRYWDGTAWTNYIAPRTSAAVASADWYADPSDATRLRYWDGTAWTGHVAPRYWTAAAPADWYPDPSDATQLRYWDGTAWTNHVTPRSRTSAALAPAAPTSHAPATQPLEEPRISMSSAEWQELVLAWMKAGVVGEELWRLISNAHIKDADDATLESQREMEKLTAQQGADRIKLMLEASPSMRDEGALAEFMKFFGGGRIVDRQYVPLRDEKIKDALRLT